MDSRQLTKQQMSDYMEKIKVDAATEFGIILPLPEDRYYNDFVEHYRNR